MSVPTQQQLGTGAVATQADAVAAAVLGCPAVADLHGGGMRQVATYLPGRRVNGVQVDDERLQVAVVGVWGISVHELDEQVRAAVAPLALGRPVHILVADLQLPLELEAAPVAVALPAGAG